MSTAIVLDTICDARIDLFRSDAIRTEQHRAARSGDGRQEFPPRRIQFGLPCEGPQVPMTRQLDQR
jgi:hypothetical protein